MTVAELRKTRAYGKIPPSEKKSKANKAQLINLLRKYESSASSSRKSPSRRSSRKSPSLRSSRKSPSRRSSRKSPSRRSRSAKGKTIAQKRIECREKGLVYDVDTGRCRASRRARPVGSRKSPSMSSRSAKGKTIAQKRIECREKGLVYDVDTGKCRASKRGKRSASRSVPPAAGRKSGDCITRSNLPLAEHQIRAARFLKTHRGLIAVHGIGTGKTLTAVAASQCFLDKFPDAKVIVISPAALIANFKKGMEEYGIDSESNKYEFFSFDAFMNRPRISSYCAGNLLIVDEAHNLRTDIDKKKGKKAFKGKKASQILLCSKSAERVLLLTATPFVNDSRDLNNLVAMAKGTDPLTKTEWKNMFQDPNSRRRYLNCLFSVYFRQQGDANYPRRVDKEVEIEMTPEYLREYMELEEENEDKLGSLGVVSPWAFLSGLRVGLLKIENSAKVDFVIKEVTKKVREGKKVVIYSNFVSAGVNNVAGRLEENSVDFYEFTGKTPAKTRKEYVADYNTGRIKVLLITKAAGEGLDLKETNAIFILDPPWNEATLEQAIGRAIRYKSHAKLPEKDRYVEVYTLFNVKPESFMRTHPYEKPSADTMIKELIDKKRQSTIEVIESLGSYSIEENSC